MSIILTNRKFVLESLQEKIDIPIEQPKKDEKKISNKLDKKRKFFIPKFYI